MKAQRILISGGLAVGGPQTHVAILCRVLREAGAEVTIAATATNWPGHALNELKALGVRVIVSPFGFGRMRFLGKLTALLGWPLVLRRDYDLVYCIGEGWMHLWAGRFVKAGGWKIYHEIVECPQAGSVAAKVGARMDAVIANSKSIGVEIARFFPRLPVRVIPFLTAHASMGAPARRARVNGGTLRVSFLGRLVTHKRPKELIEAWPKLNANPAIGPARLDLYGGDYDDVGSGLQERISTLGLGDSVQWHGAYAAAELPAIFAKTDLVVLPSLYEGLPLVLVEAMQRGIPIVATPAGGTAELGNENPDVIVTAGTDWTEFEAGVEAMARRIRGGEIDGARLHEWTESRYGFGRVADLWRSALMKPDDFFVRETGDA